MYSPEKKKKINYKQLITYKIQNKTSLTCGNSTNGVDSCTCFGYSHETDKLWKI